MDGASTASSSDLSISESLIKHPGSIRAASPCPAGCETFELKRVLDNASTTSFTDTSTSSSLVTPPGSIQGASPSPAPKRSFEQVGQIVVELYTEIWSLMKPLPENVCIDQSIAGKRSQLIPGLSSESEIDLDDLGLEHQDPPTDVRARYSQVLLAINALRNKIDKLGADFGKLVIGNDIAEEDILADIIPVSKKVEPSRDGHELAGPDPSDFQGIGAQFESPSVPFSKNPWHLHPVNCNPPMPAISLRR